MSVLIHGLEMPQEGFVEVLIRDDGTVQQTGKSYRIDGTDYYTPYVGEMPTIYKAVPVLPHGRLGDLDKLYKKMERCTDYGGAVGYHDDSLIHRDNVLFAIEEAPTVIPADGEEGEI